MSQTESSSGQETSSWHFQMALAINVLRTLNGMIQEEVQRQRPQQQASSSAEQEGRGGHVPPPTQRQERVNVEVINALCYEIQVLFPIIVSNYPLAGPRPTAPLVGGHGTDAISMVYASRIETILRRHSGQPQMLETFQQQLQAVLLLHTHNTSINTSHDHLIRELRQLIVEENERGRPGIGRRHQTNPSQVAQGLTNVLRAARDVEPAGRGETAALREMIRDFGEAVVGRDVAEERPSTIGRHLNIPSSGPSGATAVRRGERSDESPPNRGGRSEDDANRRVVMREIPVDSAQMDEWVQQASIAGGRAARRSERSNESPPRNRGGRSQNISNRQEWEAVGPLSHAEREERILQRRLSMQRGRSNNQSPSSGDRGVGSSENDSSGELVQITRRLTRAESEEWDRELAARSGPEPFVRFREALPVMQQAGIPGATTAPIGGARNVLPATRGRTGSNTNTRGAHVPSAARSLGPAQGGNPQVNGTGNGHASSLQRPGQSRRS
jgi:hypothetical protein